VIEMAPNFANEPAVQAALQLNEMGRIGFKDKLLMTLPVPIGCYLVYSGLLLAGNVGTDPVYDMARGLVRGVETMGGFVCFYLALRTYFKIRRLRRGTAA
jgi:hypothetical protein